MSNSKIVRSLWHENCTSCEDLLMNADFPALESPVSDAIGILFRFAEEALDTALSFHFQEAKEHYYSRLGKVDQLFANSPNEETEELRAVVKLLQEQHLFYFQYDTFKMPKPGVYPPTVEDQEQLIELMKMLAIKLGLNDCAKKIGSILYDPNGEETQDIFGGPAFVPRESCTSHHHIQMSKLAAFVAHSPPDPKWEAFYDARYGRHERPWNRSFPFAAFPY